MEPSVPKGKFICSHFCANQHHCHMICTLCDNWSAPFYQSLMDAGRRALVCLDLLKSRVQSWASASWHQWCPPPTNHSSFTACWMKGRQGWSYGTLEQKALEEEELLPSTFIPTQDFSDGTEFLLCFSDTTVLSACANTESVMYLKELPELPKLLYIVVEIK